MHSGNAVVKNTWCHSNHDKSGTWTNLTWPKVRFVHMLLKDAQVKKNEWPVGVVVNAIPSQDKRVHKVDIVVLLFFPFF